MVDYRLTNNELDRITDSLRGLISSALDYPEKEITRRSPLYRLTAISYEGHIVINIEVPASGELFPILRDKFLPGGESA